MGGWGKIFQLLPGEDVFSGKMNLGVPMLSGLGGRHVDDLARTVLDENVSTLPQGRALRGEAQSGTRIGRVDGVILLRKKVSIDDRRKFHRLSHGLEAH